MAAKKPVKKSGRKSPSPGTPLPWWKKHTHWILFAFGFLLYANTLGHDYTQDDAIVIYENMFTKEGIQGIPGLLSKDTFFGFFKEEGKDRLVSGGRYRPLTPIMFAVEWELFGRSPFIGHLVNTLLYGLSCMLVFLFLKRLSAQPLKGKDTWLFALLGAAIFAAHPVHTEVVANIKGRDEIMALLLSLGALYFSMGKGFKNQLLTLATIAGLFFLALLSKENAITFLAVAPLTFFICNRKSGPTIRVTITFLVGALIFLALRGSVIGWQFGDTPMEMMNNPFIKVEGGRYLPFTAGEKMATILFTLGKYLQLLFFPHPLTHDYYPRHIPIMHFGDWKVWLSLLSYIGLAIVALMGLKKKSLLSYGILFYLITLSIVSNIVFPVGTNMSERFLYMPSLGFGIALASLAINQKLLSRKVVLILAGIVCLLFSLKTLTRNPVWKDNYNLFLTDVHISQNSAKMLNEAGGELVVQSGNEPDSLKKQDMLREAVGYLEKSLEIHPRYKLAYLLMGNAHYYLKNYEQAIASFNKALEVAPDYQEAQKNLAITYRDAGRHFGEVMGNIQKSLAYLKQAYQLMPDDYETVNAYGVAQGISGNNVRAVELFERGVEIAPNNGSAYFNLAVAYSKVGNEAKANEYFKKAEELDPEILKRRSRQQ